MTNVAVFDDRTGRREALCLLLSIQPDMVCIAASKNRSQPGATLRDHVSDMLLMDADMPDILLFTINNHIRRIYPKLEVHKAGEMAGVMLKPGIV